MEDLIGPPTGSPRGERIRNVGGTPGGLGEFVIGVLLLGVGLYLFLDNVIVTSGFWSLFGPSGFGLTLVPLLVGIGILFVNGRSFLGWMLAGGGLAIIIGGVLASLHVFYKPTSLYVTLLMLGMVAAGIGLVVKSLRPHGPARGNSGD